MRLLVVEDDVDLVRALRKALDEEHFAVDVALDGDDALYQMTEISYDAIILDLMLPRRDGWSLLHALRQAGKRTPVLILTARDAIEERVRGLDLGADDYLLKPFALTELMARVRALIRRASADPSPTVVLGDVRIDTAARRVSRGEEVIELTPREYAVLELLARRRGTLVTRTMIWEHIYDDAEQLLSNAIDVHISALRRKLGQNLIVTRRGQGYIIDA
jgi:two-component system, OmpR family, response regulator